MTTEQTQALAKIKFKQLPLPVKIVTVYVMIELIFTTAIITLMIFLLATGY